MDPPDDISISSKRGRKKTDALRVAVRRAPAKNAKPVYAYNGNVVTDGSVPANDTNESLVLKLKVPPGAPFGLGAFNDNDLEGFAEVNGECACPHNSRPLENGATSYMPYTPHEVVHGDNLVPDKVGDSAPPQLTKQQSQHIQHPQSHTQHTKDTGATNGSSLRVVDLLKDFEEKTKGGEWPLTTTICCYWCCHRFDTQPYGLPMKYQEGTFHVTGCFCSLNCAAAYNMASRDSPDEVFERQTLLNLLCKRVGLGNRVRPSPPRLSLHMFGGHLNIDEFRTLARGGAGKVLTINFPPMAMLRQQIEEVNESDVASDLRYVPLDTDRINKYRERLRLQRKKPQANQNTLDAVMQFTLGANGK